MNEALNMSLVHTSKKLVVKNAKLILGLLILFFVLFSGNNAAQIVHLFSNIQGRWLLALVIISVLTSLTNSTKWGLFLRGIGQQVPPWRLFSLYLIGKFFNNFAPSMMGGDIARIFLVGRDIGSHTQSAATVIMERAMGMVGLVVVASAAVLCNAEMRRYPFVSIPIIIAVVVCLGMFAAFFSPAFSQFVLATLEHIPLVRRFSGLAGKLINALVFYRDQRRILFLSLLLSVMFHLLACLNVYTSCLAIGFSPKFFDVLVITPVVLLLAAIPLTPRGIGWWEWCFGVFLANAGGSMAQGTAVGLLLRAMAVSMSLFGGILFVLDGKCGISISRASAADET